MSWRGENIRGTLLLTAKLRFPLDLVIYILYEKIPKGAPGSGQLGKHQFFFGNA